MSTNLTTAPTELGQHIGLENSEQTNENPPQEQNPMDLAEQVAQLSLDPASSGSGEAPIDPQLCELVDRSRKHEEECPICYTEYENGLDLVLHNQCRHTFCPGCFLRAIWLRTFKCPMCRQTIRLSPELTEMHANLIRRTIQMRTLENHIRLIQRLLDRIERRLTILQQEEAATVIDQLTPPPSLFPIFSLQTLLLHSRRRLASRIEYVQRPNHRVAELHRISVKLARAVAEFYRVYQKLKARQDPHKSAEHHMAEGCFNL